jgi:hypothetical protein
MVAILLLFIVSDVLIALKIGSNYVKGDRGTSAIFTLLAGILFIAISCFYFAFFIKGRL